MFGPGAGAIGRDLSFRRNFQLSRASSRLRLWRQELLSSAQRLKHGREAVGTPFSVGTILGSTGWEASPLEALMRSTARLGDAERF